MGKEEKVPYPTTKAEWEKLLAKKRAEIKAAEQALAKEKKELTALTKKMRKEEEKERRDMQKIAQYLGVEKITLDELREMKSNFDRIGATSVKVNDGDEPVTASDR
jgi:hypothetical protein